MFLVGGGGGGIKGTQGCYEGPTGAGGYTTTKRSISVEVNKDYSIIIGGGGAASNAHLDTWGGSTWAGTGGTSSAFGFSVSGGGGGYISNSNDQGGGGSGGSGGCAGLGTPGSDGGSGYGDHYYNQVHGAGQGSTTREFAESGATLYSTGGSYGDFTVHGGDNTGNGGSGGMSHNNRYGGNGGSGIVVIRNAR